MLGCFWLCVWSVSLSVSVPMCVCVYIYIHVRMCVCSTFSKERVAGDGNQTLGGFKCKLFYTFKEHHHFLICSPAHRKNILEKYNKKCIKDRTLKNQINFSRIISKWNHSRTWIEWRRNTQTHLTKIKTSLTKNEILTKQDKSFSGGSEVKASAYNEGDPGSIPGLGKSPGEGNGNPLQYSCLENPMDREAW